nr:hypothetical protein [Mycoplasmopsis bovis]
MLEWKFNETAKYNLAYVPVQIVSLYLWVLPFYFFIPNKRLEARHYCHLLEYQD